MLRTMDTEIFGLPPTIFWPIIAVAVVLALVVLVLLVCCCYHCCCKNTQRYKYYRQYRYHPVSHRSLESYDDSESTTQPTSHRSGGESIMWPGYSAEVDSFEHEIPVVNFNQKRAILPLPRNFSNFIIDTIVPLFKEQRLAANQFAVVVLLSEEDIDNICSTRFVPSHGGKPILNKSYPSMPHNEIHYGNYIVARPNGSWHSEEEIFGKFSQLWNAYMRCNGSPPKCVLLYSWNLPCSRCTDVIIRLLNDNMYRRTSVIVAYSTYWQGELGSQYIENEEKLQKENMTVEEVRYPTFIPPA